MAEKDIGKVTDVNDDAIKLVDGLIGTYDMVLSKWKTDLNRWLNLYWCIPPEDRHYKGMANVFVPEFFRAVETLAANLYQIILAEDPWFLIEGREETDIEQSKVLEGLIDYQLQQMGFKQKLLPLLRLFLINGVCVIKVNWDYQVKKRIKKMRDPMTGDIVYSEEGEPQTYTEDEVVSDTPSFEIVDMADFYIDPTYKDINSAPWVIEREYISLSALKKMQRDGLIENVDMLDYKFQDKTKPDKNREDKFRNLGIEIDQRKTKECTVFHYWGMIPKSWVDETAENGEEVEGHIMVSHGTLLKIEENPYYYQEKPYISCSWLDLRDQFYGMGLGKILERPQLELNDNHNQSLDSKTFSIFHIWLKDRQAGIKKKDLKIVPNAIINTDKMEGLREIRPDPSAFTQAGIMDNTIREDIRNTSGAIATIQGIGMKGNQTLGEIQMLAGEGSGRLKAMAIFFAERLIKPFLTRIYQLDLQYMDVEKTVKVMGEKGFEFVPVDSSTIEGNYDFIPKVMTDITSNRQSTRENMIKFMDILSGMVQFIPNLGTSIYKLARKIYENFGFKDVQEIMPEELAQPQPQMIPPEVAQGLPMGAEDVSQRIQG